MIKRKTAAKRFTRAVRQIWLWCRHNRHRSVAEQQQMLTRKLRGHYAYYGITGNWDALSRFLWLSERAWRFWLNRRSRQADMPWDRFKRLLKRYPLPPPRVVHSVYRCAAKP